MAHETQFGIGAKASCSDGPCGEVRRMIVDPATDTVTHLVIEPRHGRHPGRLVPLDLVDTTSGEIRLRCTRAEFGELKPAEQKKLVEGRDEGLTMPLVKTRTRRGPQHAGPRRLSHVSAGPVHRPRGRPGG
jgi:hypothetical protein